MKSIRLCFGQKRGRFCEERDERENGPRQVRGQFLGDTRREKRFEFLPGITVQDSHILIWQKRARKNLAGFDLQGFLWSIGESNP